MLYYVYILECADKTLYCGYTTDLARRLEEHNSSKKGAAYTKSRRPVKIIYSESFTLLNDALKREYAIKQLSRTQKLLLVKK